VGSDPDPAPAGHIAVVLVHGIGDLRAGSVTTAACQGLRAAFPDLQFEATEPVAPAPERRGATLHRTRLTWRAATIDLVEFHWADLSGKIRLRRPVQGAQRILGVIHEFPSMALGAASTTSLRWLASTVGVSFALLLSVWALVLTGSLLELSLWPDLWLRRVSTDEVRILPVAGIIFSGTLDPLFVDNGYYASYAAQLLVMSIFVLAVVLSFAFVIVAALALAFRRLRPLGILLRTSAATAVLTVLLFFFTTWLFIMATTVYANAHLGVDRALLLIVVVFSAMAALLLMAALWLGNLLRDVVHYLGTGAGGGPQSDREDIQTALVDALNDLRRISTVTRLVIVCHSLGTVVVTDLLRNKQRLGQPERAVPIDLVTAGSPIRRLIVRLLPHRLPDPVALRGELAAGPWPVVRWFNAYRVFDFVGTRLVSRRAACDAERHIIDCPLAPRWRWPWGHANYWRDRRFTQLVAERIVAPIL
jgi:hypothetical protein